MNNPDPGNLFASTLNAVGHGDLAGQASASLEELVKSVRETSKSGEITITLKIKPRGRDSGQVEVTGTVKLNSPIADVASNPPATPSLSRRESNSSPSSCMR